jgi:asparagine synthetase A
MGTLRNAEQRAHPQLLHLWGIKDRAAQPALRVRRDPLRLRGEECRRRIEHRVAEEILEMYPELPRKQRETAILQEHPAVFIIGIGWVLKDGYPHEMRAADYDDWVTDTSKETGKDTHGLNGDILVWNHLTKRRHELPSMGIRVTKETLVKRKKILKRKILKKKQKLMKEA